MIFYTKQEELDKVLKEIEGLAPSYPGLSTNNLIETVLSEKEGLALRFARFHHVVMNESLTDWVLSPFKNEDVDLLLEHIERGYAKGIQGFDKLLEIIQFIVEIEDVNDYYIEREENIECERCEGTGGTYVSGKCVTCEGKGKIREIVTYKGNSINQLKLDMMRFDEIYLVYAHLFLDGFAECINLVEDEIEDVFILVNKFKEKRIKPLCKLIGADGNIFNLLSLASTELKKAKLLEESKEMTERVWGSQSYNEALSIILEYVEAC